MNSSYPYPRPARVPFAGTIREPGPSCAARTRAHGKARAHASDADRLRAEICAELKRRKRKANSRERAAIQYMRLAVFECADEDLPAFAARAGIEVDS